MVPAPITQRQGELGHLGGVGGGRGPMGRKRGNRGRKSRERFAINCGALEARAAIRWGALQRDRALQRIHQISQCNIYNFDYPGDIKAWIIVKNYG